MNEKTAITEAKRKDIKDYLHLYLGCEVLTNDHELGRNKKQRGRTGTFVGFADYHRMDCRLNFRAGPEGRCNIYLLKPILRPLSDMTLEERKESYRLKDDLGIGTVELFRWLLSKGFDLFGLIEAGLAIDKTNSTNSPDNQIK